MEEVWIHCRIVKKINESSHKWDEFIFIDDFERNQEKSNYKINLSALK